FETNSFEPESGMVKTLGPAIFPRILLGGIIIGSLMIIVQAWRSNNTDTVSFGPWFKIPLATALMLFQALAFEELGAFVAAGITLPSLLWVTGVQPKKILIVTACFLLFVYVFFILILRVHFPLQFLPTIFG
ncbi:MAG: tripartite tricarboxylate transporter TctB family protein, partial [Rhodospirillales bacterium]